MLSKIDSGLKLSITNRLHKEYVSRGLDKIVLDEYNPYDDLIAELTKDELSQLKKEDATLDSLFKQYADFPNCRELAYAELERIFPSAE